MPRYEHACRDCGLDWLEEYSVNDDPPETCPECESRDVYRCVTTGGMIHFKGAGWSPDGYSKDAPLGTWGKQLKVYDRKEDAEREAVGKEKQRVKKRLLRQNEAIKRTMGYDATIKEAEAERKINEAGAKKKNKASNPR